MMFPFPWGEKNNKQNFKNIYLCLDFMEESL